MKIIIAGGRDFDDYELMVGRMAQVERELEIDGRYIGEVVSGGAKGADKLGETWAWFNEVPVKIFPADWSKGKGAGIIRNKQMANHADGLVAFWDGKSRGTLSMIQEARSSGLYVHIVRYKEEQKV